LPSAAIFRTHGRMSPNNSTHLPMRPAAHQRNTPVMLPPGLPRLAIKTLCGRGLAGRLRTMGRSRVACCAARGAWCVESNEDTTFATTSSAASFGSSSSLPCAERMSNEKSSPFDIACFRQSLPHLFAEGLGRSAGFFFFPGLVRRPGELRRLRIHALNGHPATAPRAA